MGRKLNYLLLTIAAIYIAVISVFAAPSFIHYQGILTDNLGDPISDGEYNMVFVIYDAEIEGNDLWTEVRTTVTNGAVETKNGKFHVKLGEYEPLDETVFAESGRWLGITVGNDNEMSPRTPIGSVPYAFMAGTVPDKTLGHEKIKNKAIADSLLDDKAVGPDKVKLKAIADSLLDDKAVGPDKVKLKAIADSLLDDKAVGPDKVKLKAIADSLLDDKAVGPDKVKLKAIADSLIDDKAVGHDKIKNNAIVDSLIDSDAVTTEHIRNYTILFEDLDANDADLGDVIKWNGTIWEASPDLTGVAESGWIDDGTKVRLVTSTDYVGIGVPGPNGPLHIDDQDININYPNLSNYVAPLIINSTTSSAAILIDNDQIEQAGAASTLYLNKIAGSHIALAVGGGYVGIGTNAPNGPLHVDDRNLNLSPGNYNNGIAPLIVRDDYNNVSLLIDADQIEHAPQDPFKTLYLNKVSSSDIAMAMGGGQVGIGTSSPGAKLHINSSGTIPLYVAGDDQTFLERSGTGMTNILTLYNPDETDGNGISLVFRSNAGATSYAFAGIQTEFTSHVPINSDMVFYTRDDSDWAERLRIKSNGYVGINTNMPTEALHVVGNICYTGTSGSCSDDRFKANVETLTGAVNKLSGLRAVSFDWRRDKYPEYGFSGERQIGFIAQEAMEYIPHAVSKGNSGYYSIDYGKLTPILVAAIQEQQQTIEQLKARVEMLLKLYEESNGADLNKINKQ